MRRAPSFWLLSVLCLTVVFLAGCTKQPTLVTPPSGPPQPPPAQGWGCLYEAEDGLYWIGEEAGGQPVVVLSTQGDRAGLFGVEVSPDGTRLAVDSEGQCRIVDLATGSQTVVWTAETDGGPMAWSPDSQTLANVQGGVLRLFRGIGPNTTLVSDRLVGHVGWSPDGTLLAYTRRDKEDKDLGLFVIPAAGGTPKRLAKGTNDIFGAADPSWSPDGKWIAFMHAWEGGALCFVKADGTGYRPDVAAAFNTAVWLADSSAVVYVGEQDEMTTSGVFRCTPTGKPVAITTGQNTWFEMALDGRLLLAINPPHDSKQPPRVKLLATPSAQAKVLWKREFTGTGVETNLRPDGAAVAFSVGDDGGEGALWVGPLGQEPTRRMDKIRRLHGWCQAPH